MKVLLYFECHEGIFALAYSPKLVSWKKFSISL